MNTKESFRHIRMLIFLCINLLILIIIYLRFMPDKQSLATDEIAVKSNKIKISSAETIDLEKIIQNNINSKIKSEEIYERQEELEYITKYRYSDELYVGTTRVAQEGKNGIQTISMRKQFDASGNFLKEEQLNAVVTKSSLDKIIEIGTKIYVEPPKPTVQETSRTNQSNNETLDFNMNLNNPSKFTIEQFKEMLTDEKDKNKIFEENSDYFYYIEEQYNINGVFVAAIGIHESAWGTSKIATAKYNLFGYGAYDSNPYNGAYTFSSYSESIDLLARVLVKYYLNPSGTKIYDGQTASGKYYNGNSLTNVNQKYATDKNWANCVYKHMQYLYNKVQKK